MLESLLSADENHLLPDIDDHQLQKFKETYGASAFVCRYLHCLKAVDGFDSQQQRNAHEATHQRMFRCAHPSCAYFRGGFATGNALNKHNEKYHNTIVDRGTLEQAIIAQKQRGVSSTRPLADSQSVMVKKNPRTVQSKVEETLNTNLFGFSHGPPSSVLQVAIELDEGDQKLLDYFISDVLPTVFPILETNQHGFTRTDYVLPALQRNKCYLHCCLSIAAQHYKATINTQGEQIDKDIMRHRYATISELADALNRDTNHSEILEATLGMTFFQCFIGRFDDSLPDIPWHQHFRAAISLAQKLELNRIVSESHNLMSFNMALTAWIDILGSTIQGRAPTFADTYREKHLSPTNSSLGLRELMGCEDRVMYLISEIACLEVLKKDGIDDIRLCQHVHALGDQISLTEIGDRRLKIPFNANGVLSPKQLSKNMTATFQLTARIYLCSLVPGFSPSNASCVGLVSKLTQVLEFIPSGQVGFDRSLTWVYLIGGSVSTIDSPFRSFFKERLIALGNLANFGSFGRVACLLKEVWSHVDGRLSPGGGEAHYVSWRDAMQMKGWDFLLI